VNQLHTIGGNIVAIVDAQNLDGTPTQNSKPLFDKAWQQMRAIEKLKEETGLPLLFFTHIPLHKPGGQPGCPGDKPETIVRRGVVVTQTMLSPNTTNYILNKLQPRFVFTGHDHHGCTYRHNDHTTEYTLVSMLGDYGGSSAIFDIHEIKPGEFDYTLTRCPFYTTGRVYLYLLILLPLSWLLFLFIKLLMCCCCCNKSTKPIKSE
jgi:hypothetical protein